MAEGTQGTIITWNFTNWVTVVLMALIAFGGIGFAQKWYQSRNAGG